MSDAVQSPLALGDLSGFTGSEVFYRHPLSAGCVYTEGVQYLAERASAYWLIDAILCPQGFQANLRETEFQAWTLTVHEDRSATLACDDGDGNIVDSHRIPWTDFPLPCLTLWFANNTLYLPSEH
ncbi:MAG: hypothetical protein K2Y02_05060 [Burkholderiaceae bacterium]|nr:hypothetical protein [Burkholderiaceae bacterium]